jgi:hypothetical protein
MTVVHGPRRADAGTYDAWSEALRSADIAAPVQSTPQSRHDKDDAGSPGFGRRYER